MPYSSSSKLSSSNMSRVFKAPIVACLTCPLCGNLFREATTISECLHTFCKDCIHERFSDEETNSCPMCNVDLGTVPLEKLRADPQLDDVQTKIFNANPKRRPVVNARPVVQPPVQSNPVRRKERSLSSLGVFSAPSSSKPPRRSRKKLWRTESSESDYQDESKSSAAESQDDDDAIYCSETLESDSKSAGGRAGTTSRKRRRARASETKQQQQQQGNEELAALACLELAQAEEKDNNNPRNVRGGTSKSVSLRATKNVRRSSQGRIDSPANGITKAAQASPSSASTPSNGLWFSLKSASNQGDESGLPQIKKPYLRINDGRLPLSFVKKYLVKKLDLKSESEVEITCRGQPIVSSLPLESVRKIWLTQEHSASQERGGQTSSSTGQEILMVLTYGKNKRAAVS